MPIREDEIPSISFVPRPRLQVSRSRCLLADRESPAMAIRFAAHWGAQIEGELVPSTIELRLPLPIGQSYRAAPGSTYRAKRHY